MLALTWGLAVGQATADVDQVSGSAFGEQVDVTVLGLPLTSGPLPTVTLPPSGGGPFTNSVLSVTVPNLLTTGLLRVRTEGATGPTGFARSSAEVFDVTIPDVLTADVVRSQCRSDSSGSTGSTTLVGASILGGPAATINPAPNTVIEIPLVGTLILNEQVESENPGSTSITVNAIHLELDGILGTGDIIVAQSHCDAVGPNVNTTTTTSSTTTSSTTTSSTTTSSTTTSTTTPIHGRCDGHTATIRGTDGPDVITGTEGDDVIVGLGGNDEINGLGGEDVICGNGGDDVISGGSGDDNLFGGPGNDQLDGGPHVVADGCFGGPGTDTAVNCERVEGVP